MEAYDVICMGTGEIGRPLYELFNGVYKTLPVDLVHYPNNEVGPCNFLHVCIPGGLKTFKEEIKKIYLLSSPKYIIIHSTVKPGTIDKMQTEFTCPIIHSPVQGKHAGNQMKKDLLRYPKYLGFPYSITEEEKKEVIEHFEGAGFALVKPIMGTRNTEWQKVLATSMFGWQIAWSQEVERICDEFGLDFNAVTDPYNYIEDIIPPHYPGVIGGHCVMPNIDLVSEIHSSPALEFIKKSNELKKERENGLLDNRPQK